MELYQLSDDLAGRKCFIGALRLISPKRLRHTRSNLFPSNLKLEGS